MNGHYIIKINNKCNSNCSFCADSKEVRKQADIEYDKLISELIKNRKKFDSLIISGGEPTIYKNIFKYIKYAKKKCKYKKIILTTNGFLLAYEKFTDKLIKNGVDSFIISFLTHEKKKYFEISKIKNSFNYINKAISNIKKRKKEINVNIVIHKLNYKNIEKTVEFLINKKINSIQFSFINPIGSSIINDKSIITERMSKVILHLKSAINYGIEKNYNNIFIENIPICIAPTLIKKISDLKKPKENKKYYNSSKIKLEKCKECIHNQICDGIWKAYHQQFGDSEFKPILKKKELKIKLIMPPRYYNGTNDLTPIMSYSTAKLTSLLALSNGSK
ncbi:radical SAM protein [Candidatus Woesearchaeota archaeon]|nr:radical SAM protein [Candidatus Woesearchaeota archaeon]